MSRCGPSSLSEGAQVQPPHVDPSPRPGHTRRHAPQAVCITKTVNTLDIPGGQPVNLEYPAAAAPVTQPSSFNKAAVSTATYPTVGSATGTKTSLSNERFRLRTGWTLPPGGGLRGGAPLPGETSAISNGTSGWGPPPSNSHAQTGGWGSAPPANAGAVSAWGNASVASSMSDDVANGQKLLNTGLNVSSAPSGALFSVFVFNLKQF